jgi:hypothetical protein
MTTTMPSEVADLQGEFRADPGAHVPIILVCGVIALLCIAGVVWGFVRPGATLGGGLFLALVLGAVAIACLVVAGYFGLRLRRRYELSPRGLNYFDGQTTHAIAWGDVAEICEEVSSVKMLGITVDSPKIGLVLTTQSGVRCEVNQDIRGYQTLAPLISREVNRDLGQRAIRQLSARQPVRFGPLLLAMEGVRLEAPPPRHWQDTLKENLEGQKPTRVVVPGQHAWQDIVVRIVPATEGDKLSRHTNYNELQILTRGSQDPVFAWPIPQFPNFAVFVSMLKGLKQPLHVPEQP